LWDIGRKVIIASWWPENIHIFLIQKYGPGSIVNVLFVHSPSCFLLYIRHLLQGTVLIKKTDCHILHTYESATEKIKFEQPYHGFWSSIDTCICTLIFLRVYDHVNEMISLFLEQKMNEILLDFLLGWTRHMFCTNVIWGIWNSSNTNVQIVNIYKFVINVIEFKIYLCVCILWDICTCIYEFALDTDWHLLVDFLMTIYILNKYTIEYHLVSNLRTIYITILKSILMSPSLLNVDTPYMYI